MSARLLTVVGVLALLASAQGQRTKSVSLALQPNTLETVNTEAKIVKYKGRTCLQLLPLAGKEQSDEGMLAILTGSTFKDGTIEVELSGAPRADATPDMRGFIGIAFRVQPKGEKFELFYVRPSNGRSDDQLRRNHSVQYQSEPDYIWKRLRTESPGLYESYADLVPGEWTKLKIVVFGTKAKLYVNGADQPALIVNDLKLGDSQGAIALWSHTSTDGYFSNLTVK
jgi:Domain of Unknown Function (DUF1080)